MKTKIETLQFKEIEATKELFAPCKRQRDQRIKQIGGKSTKERSHQMTSWPAYDKQSNFGVHPFEDHRRSGSLND